MALWCGHLVGGDVNDWLCCGVDNWVGGGVNDWWRCGVDGCM